MATAIGDLVVRLGSQTQGFERGMSRSQKGAERFVSRATAGFRRLLSFAGPLAGLASVAGFAFMVKQQLAAIDSTAKLSDQIGVSTERLQGLRHAAELTGAGAKTLDAALATMAKRLGEGVRRGTGPAVEALNDLGLEIDEIGRLSPDEAFYRIADAIGAIEDPAARNAIAANLFSKANMALLNTLSAGSAGLREMQEEAEKLGLTFSRFDARQVEDANDAITRMKASLGGIGRVAAIELAPILEAMSNVATSTREAGAGIGWFQERLIGLKLIALDIAEAGARVQVAMHPFDPQQYEAELQAVLNARTRLEQRIAELTTGGIARPGRPPEPAGIGLAPQIEDALDSVPTAAEKATESVSKLRDEWDRQIETFGMSDLQRQMFDIRKLLPDDPFALEALQKQADQIADLAKGREMGRFAEELAARFIDPAERIRKEIGEIQDAMIEFPTLMIPAGETAIAALRKQLEEEEEPSGMQRPRHAAAAGFQTQQAYSMILAATGKTDRTQEKNAKANEDNLEENKTQTALLGQVVVALDTEPIDLPG